MTILTSSINGNHSIPDQLNVQQDASTTTTKPKESPATLTRAAIDFLDAFSTLSPAIVTSYCTPDFTHSISPASLSLPSRGLEEFTTHSGRVFSLFTSWEIVPTSIFEDTSKNTVVLHVKMGGKVKGNVLGGRERWDNEAVFWIELAQFEGKWMVRDYKEFVDSKLAEELRRLLTGTAKEKTLEE